MIVAENIQSVMTAEDADVFTLPTLWPPATPFASTASQAKRGTISTGPSPFDLSWCLEIRSLASHRRHRGVGADGHQNRDGPLAQRTGMASIGGPYHRSYQSGRH